MDRDINAAINILHRAGQVRWSISKTNRLRLLQEAPLIY
jgi:transposase